MIDSSFEVILCYKAHPGKEINDSGGEFPGTSDFISSSYPSASRFLAPRTHTSAHPSLRDVMRTIGNVCND
jgi:hypothetical protein